MASVRMSSAMMAVMASEQCVRIVIDRVGDAVLERDGRKLRRAGQGDLDGPGSVFAQKWEVRVR